MLRNQRTWPSDSSGKEIGDLPRSPSVSYMNVIDVMTENPITVRADESLRAALETMEENNIKHLPVLSQAGHMIGVISDRDVRYALNSPYVLREHWQDLELANTLRVRAVMTAAPIIIEPQMGADEAARMMLVHRIGCLPVMRSETLIGIITRSDLLVAFMTVHRHYEERLHSTAKPQALLSTENNGNTNS